MRGAKRRAESKSLRPQVGDVPRGGHHLLTVGVDDDPAGGVDTGRGADDLTIAGQDQPPYAALPWFWSDQYDVKLQIAGLNAGYDHVAVRAGAGPARSHWYFRGSELLAIDAMNDPRAYMVGKRLIEAGRSPRPAQVADADTDLKTLL